jgi:aryl-alcohol dehydrogenase-like predicted oxidoreductase
MRIRTLGRTGLRVSEVCLGAMTFGMPEWGCDERESLALVDRFLDAGGNFIDTADAYSGTISEEICGKAMAGRRNQIVLATKCTMPVGSGPNDRGASRKHIRESCEASLRRLRTDYIDLYQIHVEDLWTPLEETLAALDDLVHAGKVLYTGASNFRAYRLMKALALSDRHGWARFASLQPQYNLLVRSIEREHFALAREEGIGLITWSPLAAGMLTGKITRDHKPPQSRLAQRDFPLYRFYFNERAFAGARLAAREARGHRGDRRRPDAGAARREPHRHRRAGPAGDHGAPRGSIAPRARVSRGLHRLHPGLAR